MSKLSEILYLDTVLRKAKETYKEKMISLIENRKDATLTNVIVSGLDPDYLALKPDKCGFQIFKTGYGSKQCDYILLSEIGGKKVAVFVELKSSVNEYDANAQTPQASKQKDSSELTEQSTFENINQISEKYEDYVTQLTGSTCLFDFLHSVLVNFFNCPILGNDYKRYYAVLHNTNVPTIGDEVPLTRPESNDSPQKAYIRKTENNAQLTLRQLIR